MPAWRLRLEHYFEFEALGTNWKTEILNGVTLTAVLAVWCTGSRKPTGSPTSPEPRFNST